MAATQRRFAVMGENLFKIANKLITNSRLCRLLKYQDENSLYTASTKLDFPDKGNSYTLYKASDEQRLYQWNQELNRYEAILTSEGGSDPVVDIQIIYGGNAHGNN